MLQVSLLVLEFMLSFKASNKKDGEVALIETEDEEHRRFFGN